MKKETWRKVERFKMFNIDLFEKETFSIAYEGEGEMIVESVPNKEYFEHEFRKKVNRRDNNGK